MDQIETPGVLRPRLDEMVIARTGSEEWYGKLWWLGVGLVKGGFTVVLSDAWGPMPSDSVKAAKAQRFTHFPLVRLARVLDVATCTDEMIKELERRRSPEPEAAAPSERLPADPPTWFVGELIADPVAGLEWDRSFEIPLIWEGVMRVLRGRPQWRIPTLLEWASLSGPPQLAVLRERGARYWVANHSWAPGTWTIDSEKMARPAVPGEVAYLRLVRDLPKEVA